jgi:hypothetical protein
LKKLTTSLLVTAGAIALSATTAAPALAVTSAAAPDSPVKVTTENGGVQVYTGLPGQPLVSVSADSNGVCTGFSYQVGNCIPVGPID